MSLHAVFCCRQYRRKLELDKNEESAIQSVRASQVPSMHSETCYASYVNIKLCVYMLIKALRYGIILCVDGEANIMQTT